jgi:integrase
MAKVCKRRGRYVLDYYDNEGKRRWQTLKEGTTLKDAKKKLREIEVQLENGTYLPVFEIPTFKNTGEEWLTQKKANVRESTYRMYKRHLDLHYKEIDSVKINKISIATVENFIQTKQKGKLSL